MIPRNPERSRFRICGSARGPIASHYLIKQANFVACHHPQFLERYDVLGSAVEPGGVFLLNTPHGPDDIWQHLPREAQEQIAAKKLKFYVIDAAAVARAAGVGGRINTIMQTCFFAISGVLPPEEAIAEIKKAIKKTYGRKGEQVVQQNFAAVDRGARGTARRGRAGWGNSAGMRCRRLCPKRRRTS